MQIYKLFMLDNLIRLIQKLINDQKKIFFKSCILYIQN